MKTNKVISYILIIIAILIFAYEVVATLINQANGFWIHLVIILIVLLYLVYKCKNM